MTKNDAIALRKVKVEVEEVINTCL